MWAAVTSQEGCRCYRSAALHITTVLVVVVVLLRWLWLRLLVAPVWLQRSGQYCAVLVHGWLESFTQDSFSTPHDLGHMRCENCIQYCREQSRLLSSRQRRHTASCRPPSWQRVTCYHGGGREKHGGKVEMVWRCPLARAHGPHSVRTQGDIISCRAGMHVKQFD